MLEDGEEALVLALKVAGIFKQILFNVKCSCLRSLVWESAISSLLGDSFIHKPLFRLCFSTFPHGPCMLSYTRVHKSWRDCVWKSGYFEGIWVESKECLPMWGLQWSMKWQAGTHHHQIRVCKGLGQVGMDGCGQYRLIWASFKKGLARLDSFWSCQRSSNVPIDVDSHCLLPTEKNLSTICCTITAAKKQEFPQKARWWGVWLRGISKAD